MIDSKVLSLKAPEYFSDPFPYFTDAIGFGVQSSFEILTWLETVAPWVLTEADFYEQYEFSLYDAVLPPKLRFLTGDGFLGNLRSRVEKIFGSRLAPTIDCTAHKLVAGQRIRIHNDFIPGGETHRVIVQLNRGWNDAQGGLLMLFNSGDPSDVHRVITPTHDTVFGFAISNESYHAVSRTHAGERFTMVFSFYSDAAR